MNDWAELKAEQVFRSSMNLQHTYDQFKTSLASAFREVIAEQHPTQIIGLSIDQLIDAVKFAESRGWLRSKVGK